MIKVFSTFTEELSNNQTLKSIFKEREYYYFDTHTILLKARKKGPSYPLMDENIKTVKKNNLPSFLICDDDLINYYLKFKWKLLDKEDFEVKDHKFLTNGMIFNDNMFEEKIGVKKNLNLNISSMFIKVYKEREMGRLLELVDKIDSKSIGRKTVTVRVGHRPPKTQWI